MDSFNNDLLRSISLRRKLKTRLKAAKAESAKAKKAIKERFLVPGYSGSERRQKIGKLQHILRAQKRGQMKQTSRAYYKKYGRRKGGRGIVKGENLNTARARFIKNASMGGRYPVHPDYYRR